MSDLAVGGSSLTSMGCRGGATRDGAVTGGGSLMVMGCRAGRNGAVACGCGLISGGGDPVAPTAESSRFDSGCRRRPGYSEGGSTAGIGCWRERWPCSSAEIMVEGLSRADSGRRRVSLWYTVLCSSRAVMWPLVAREPIAGALCVAPALRAPIAELPVGGKASRL